MSTLEMRATSYDDLLYAAINLKVPQFREYLSSESFTGVAGGGYTKAWSEFNPENLTARIQSWDRDKLMKWLKMTYEEIRAQGSKDSAAWHMSGKTYEPDDLGFYH